MNIHGAAAAIKAFDQAMHRNTVPPKQVEDRFRVCKTCPKKRKISGLTSRISQFLGRVANSHHVPQELSGYKCSVCKCGFLLLLPALKEDLHKDTPEQTKARPEGCWMNTES
jgi:hypothetical protein